MNYDTYKVKLNIDFNNIDSWFNNLHYIETWLNNNIGKQTHEWAYTSDNNHIYIGFTNPEYKTAFLLYFS